MHDSLPKTPVSGLLYSQVGYESALPVRVVVRGPTADHLPKGAICRLTGPAGEHTAPCVAWGALWRSHWWVAEFPAGLAGGSYAVEVRVGERVVHAADGLEVGTGILWNSTVRPMCVRMLEARAWLAQAAHGWQDAGTMWQESTATSAMVIGLTDVIELGGDLVDAAMGERIQLQIANGCDYLVLTQDEAARRGYPDGAMSHDVLGHEDRVLPADAQKVVVAWRRAQRLLPQPYHKRKYRYQDGATRALRWLHDQARPMGAYGFCHRQRGLPADTAIPADAWMTRDLLMLLRAEFETWRAGDGAARDQAVATARLVMARQIPIDRAEQGFHGHFTEFDSLPHSEKSWCHSNVARTFGADSGGFVPHDLTPFCVMLRAWPDHPDAPRWRDTLHRFATGYLLPACRASPFRILPLGVFGDQGLLWFTGPYHGMNAIYGWAAALALDLHAVLEVPELIDVAYGNLQWIAGLNAGITREAIDAGCAIFDMDVPPGTALPASMIYGVGRRSAGSWLATRGVVCNGFCTGQQFRHDIDCLRELDGPFSFTDEDWLPHSAAWLSGLVRLMPWLDAPARSR